MPGMQSKNKPSRTTAETYASSKPSHMLWDILKPFMGRVRSITLPA